jgi:hypothetical protein
VIKSWPGWINYFALFLFYFLVGLGLDWIGGFYCDKRFIAMFSAIYAGGYLAKWQWTEKTLPDGTKVTEHRFW